MNNIRNILGRGGDVAFIISSSDLKEFADSLIADAVKLQEKAEKERAEEDGRITRTEACKLLGVTKQTMWRWAKRGYLEPVAYRGMVPVYKISQVLALLGQK